MANVFSRIKDFNADRIQSLWPLKQAALAESAFRFYRGTAHLFYEDLSKEKSFTRGPKTWICGDLHIENFGTYKGDNRLVYFDINDFDECVLAPVTLEIIRVITSIYIASADLIGDKKKTQMLAEGFLMKYLSTIETGKSHSFERETARGVVRKFIRAVSKRKNKEVLAKRTEMHKGKIRLAMIKGKTLPTPEKTAKVICRALDEWAKNRKYSYQVRDIANRIMGTGSLGVERYIALCHNTLPDKPILLDVKEARESCVMDYFDLKQPAWENTAHRINSVQPLVQDTPPALLDHWTIGEKHYVIKELQPSQDKLDLIALSHKAHKFDGTIQVMADIAASAHLRATGRYKADTGDDLIEFVSRLNPKEILEYSFHYAKKVRQDYKEFLAAI